METAFLLNMRIFHKLEAIIECINVPRAMKLRFVNEKNVLLKPSIQLFRTNDANHLQKQRRCGKLGGFNS
ncbi:hypothetical protein PGB90_001566 [Kerria lacca]